MARVGDEFLNPVSGQRLVFVRTTEDTNGELLEVESTYAAGGQQPPVHYHPAQEERFEVLRTPCRSCCSVCSLPSAACSATAPSIPARGFGGGADG